MVIFHSYVSLPEGRSNIAKVTRGHASQPPRFVPRKSLPLVPPAPGCDMLDQPFLALGILQSLCQKLAVDGG